MSHATSILSASMNLVGLCRFLRSCKCEQPDALSFRLFLTHLHRRLGVQMAITDILKKCSPNAKDGINDQVELISLLGSIGMDEIFTRR